MLEQIPRGPDRFRAIVDMFEGNTHGRAAGFFGKFVPKDGTTQTIIAADFVQAIADELLQKSPDDPIVLTINNSSKDHQQAREGKAELWNCATMEELQTIMERIVEPTNTLAITDGQKQVLLASLTTSPIAPDMTFHDRLLALPTVTRFFSKFGLYNKATPEDLQLEPHSDEGIYTIGLYALCT